MSRSFKHTNCGGHTYAASDKPFKETVNRKLRHKIRQLMHVFSIDPEVAEAKSLPIVDEVENAYNAPKDGKSFYGPVRPEWISEEDWQKMFRK